MSRPFLRIVAVVAALVATVGCGGGGESRTIAKSEYVEDCSRNAGREHCACVWHWFERNVSGERRREIAKHEGEPHYRAPELLRADAECARVTDIQYVESCVDVGATRSYCECLWRWYLRNVSRARALEIDRRAREDGHFRSPERVRADRYCS